MRMYFWLKENYPMKVQEGMNSPREDKLMEKIEDYWLLRETINSYIIWVL